ncbi:hypothetical protein FOZ60_006760 [Perkinsus olseni]|uniref:Uncharacterized protein n=1 Tax=Perkinsus olseni TaxID=32597 RepID=A0A7J6NMX2_PEROL|nr:hypothetical protein FOZ60_006760 [Perkinsus olseni]
MTMDAASASRRPELSEGRKSMADAAALLIERVVRDLQDLKRYLARDQAEAELERFELVEKCRKAELEAEAQEGKARDYLRRISMLEFALKRERATVEALQRSGSWGGWRSALIVRLLNTELADRPVRYDRKPHVVGGDPVSMEDSGIELIPQRSNLPDTVIWRLPKYRNSGVRSQFAALAPVIDGDVRMVGSPGLTAKSEGGQMLMSRDAANLIDVATDCSHGNVIEFLKNFKESRSMRAIVRFTRMATIAFGVVIILLAWTAFGCTTGYRKKLRRDAKLSRQRLEALRANMPAKVEAGEATSPQGSDRGSGGDGVDGGAAAEVTSEEEESSEYDSDEDYREVQLDIKILGRIASVVLPRDALEVRGFSTWTTDSPPDDVSLDTQAYWEAMRTDGASPEEAPADLSWAEVDSSLRSTFRGVDLAELHRGEPAGEDNIYTNNVLWQSSDDTLDDEVENFDEVVSSDEDVENLSKRFTDTTAKYGVWKDPEVEHSFTQQSPLTPIFSLTEDYAVPPNFRGRRVEVVENSVRRDSQPARLSVEEPYLCRCSGAMRSSEENARGRSAGSLNSSEKVLGITREFRGDKQLPPENYIDPPKNEIGSLEGVRERLLDVLIGDKSEKSFMEDIPMMWGCWKESIIFVLPTEEACETLLKALARCGYTEDRVVRVEPSREAPSESSGLPPAWSSQERWKGPEQKPRTRQDPREQQQQQQQQKKNRREKDLNPGHVKRKERSEEPIGVPCLLCKGGHENERCPYFRQSVVLRSSSEVFNKTKWGNQRWLDSTLSKAGYGATFKVAWWENFGASKVAAVACLNHANAEKMLGLKKLELPGEVLVEVEAVPHGKDDPRRQSTKRQRCGIAEDTGRGSR